jgi:glycine dehydrogenase subunit 2
MSKSASIIFDKSVKGRMGVKLPASQVPSLELSENINTALLREIPAELPEITEPEVVRHFVNLSTKNHHVDKDFYPLGSCTMKYNPKINDVIASMPGFAGLHPDQPEETTQGALQLMYELEQMMKKINYSHYCQLNGNYHLLDLN